MSTSDPITRLFQAARGYLPSGPFGEPRDYGFETRLRAAIAERAPSLAEVVSRFSWRFSFAAVPLLVIVAVILTYQTQGALPVGIEGFVAQWSELIPVGF
ncbi:MAG: hypothetical protein HRU46_14285 [Verrucomicrobiales bacterium]|nr:hypothetical protein [Verrucomicrobiales bacterium]